MLYYSPFCDNPKCRFHQHELPLHYLDLTYNDCGETKKITRYRMYIGVEPDVMLKLMERAEMSFFLCEVCAEVIKLSNSLREELTTKAHQAPPSLPPLSSA